ncbi:MAG TPA: amidohydrolase family protein, partial [Chloroflexota bacterium]|nr:amidohydrolase family protein [Chloroflexota bacterium]
LVVAAGHTTASYTEMQEAVTWGIDHVTHFYNAMRGLHHREPGVVGAGLTLQELYLEVIADGIHVHPGALRLAYQAKGPRRLMLVTDAVEYAGMAEGVYEEGDRKLLVENGSIRMQDGTLAGSTLTMDQAVALMVRQVGAPLEEAIAMASSVPAERLGLSNRKGSLTPGKDADLVVLDDHFDVQLTAVSGNIIFQR